MNENTPQQNVGRLDHDMMGDVNIEHGRMDPALGDTDLLDIEKRQDPALGDMNIDTEEREKQEKASSKKTALKQ